MENAKELIRINPQTKERWQWVRYVEHRSFDEPTGRYVCEHLKPGERALNYIQACCTDSSDEIAVDELADIASEDPSALDCHYTVRLCAACADVYQANVDRRHQQIAAFYKAEGGK